MTKPSFKEHYLWIDPRSRALFRISMGLVLVEEWIRRWIERDVFLYNSGVLPHGVFSSQFSLLNYLADGWPTDLFLLFGLVCFLLFTFGFFTRFAHVLTFLFQLQLAFRNEPVNNAGDVITSCFLFWTLFIPLGEVWSMDRRFRPDALDWRPKRHWAALAIYIQFFVLYGAAAVSKTGPFWGDGSALHYFWNLTFGGRLGLFLAAHLPFFVIQFMSAGALLCETFVPIAVLFPPSRFPIRRLAAFALISMHLGIDFTFFTGGFQYASISACFLLLDRGFWDGFPAGLKRHFKIIPQGTREMVRSFERAFAFGICTMSALTIYTGASDAAQSRLNRDVLHVPKPVSAVFASLNMTQIWRMYAPQPGNLRRWWVFQATLADGSYVDLVSGRPADFTRPENLGGRQSRYWTRYAFMMPVPYFQKLAPYLADYLIRKNSNLPMRKLDLIFIDQTSPTPGSDTANPLNVYSLYSRDLVQKAEQWFPFRFQYNWNWERL